MWTKFVNALRAAWRGLVRLLRGGGRGEEE
jgi:hypothetical protein